MSAACNLEDDASWCTTHKRDQVLCAQERFTREDAEDGVPGAGRPSDYPQTPKHHDPRVQRPLDPGEARDVAEALDEGLDTPADPKRRQEAVLALLISIGDSVPARHAQEIREALGKAYDQGAEDEMQAWVTEPDSPNPLDGAIDRLKGTGHDPSEHREVSWALNEAFRNGMESAQPKVDQPDVITVHVPGIPFESEDGQIGACDWTATPVKTRDPYGKVPAYALPDRFWEVAQQVALEGHKCAFPETGSTGWVLIPGLRAPTRMEGDPHDKIEYWQATNFGPPYGPVQLRIEDPRGNPNEVAVGRFKASLRKFLGVD